MKKTRIILPALLLVCAVAMICVCFSGCLRVDRIIPGSDTADDSYMSLDGKLRDEDYGYEVTTYTVDQMTNNEISGLQARVTAEKTANGNGSPCGILRTKNTPFVGTGSTARDFSNTGSPR